MEGSQRRRRDPALCIVEDKGTYVLCAMCVLYRNLAIFARPATDDDLALLEEHGNQCRGLSDGDCKDPRLLLKGAKHEETEVPIGDAGQLRRRCGVQVNTDDN